MASLVQARRKIKDAGRPIHSPVDALKKMGAEIRRGQLTIIAAGAGGAKTAFTQAVLTHGDSEGKEKVLYFCSDTTADVMFRRAAALLTTYSQSEVDRMIEANAFEALEHKVLNEAGHIEWEFRPHVTPSFIEDRLSAYVELHGEFPTVIVMDILRDLSDSQDADEFRALEDAAVFLRDLATDTGAATIALHHTTAEFGNGDRPVPLSGVRGQVSKTPALVYTLHRPEPNELRVSIAKNRGGQADASGRLFARVRVDLDQMIFQG